MYIKSNNIHFPIWINGKQLDVMKIEKLSSSDIITIGSIRYCMRISHFRDLHSPHTPSSHDLEQIAQQVCIFH